MARLAKTQNSANPRKEIQWREDGGLRDPTTTSNDDDAWSDEDEFRLKPPSSSVVAETPRRQLKRLVPGTDRKVRLEAPRVIQESPGRETENESEPGYIYLSGDDTEGSLADFVVPDSPCSEFAYSPRPPPPRSHNYFSKRSPLSNPRRGQDISFSGKRMGDVRLDLSPVNWSGPHIIDGLTSDESDDDNDLVMYTPARKPRTPGNKKLKPLAPRAKRVLPEIISGLTDTEDEDGAPASPQSIKSMLEDVVDKAAPRKAPSTSKIPETPRRASRAVPASVPKIPKTPHTGRRPVSTTVAKTPKRKFNEVKNNMVKNFLVELDDTVCGGRVRERYAATGGIQVIWSKTLRTTAGRATESYSRRHPGGYVGMIELSDRILDEERKTMDTVAHEFAHLCVYAHHGRKCRPHGKEFHAWARKIEGKFSHMNLVIEDTHSYDLNRKYEWTCQKCSAKYDGASKKLFEDYKGRCRGCRGHLIQTRPKPKPLSVYAEFVAKNHKRVQEANPGAQKSEIFALIAKEWREYKNGSKSTEEKSASVEVVEVSESEDETGKPTAKVAVIDLSDSESEDGLEKKMKELRV